MNKNIIGLLLVLALINAQEIILDNNNGIILAPIDKSKPVGILFIVGGASCKAQQYIELAKQIQSTSDLSLYIGIPKYAMDLPLAPGPGIYNVKLEFKALGIESDNIFYAGHSLGGVNIQSYVEGLASKTKGLILLGSYMKLSQKNPSVTYPVPVLTLAGELDGLTKITRVVLAFDEALTNIEKNLKSHLLIVLKGVSHAQFANDEIPPFVQKNDLRPEITLKEAHTKMAEVINAFIKVNSVAQDDINAIQTLKKYFYGETGQTIKPIYEAFLLEGNYLLSQANKTSNQWIILGQQLVADIKSLDIPTQNIEVQSEKIDSLPSFTLSKPSVSLNGTKLEFTSQFRNVYSALQFLDVSQLSSTSADQISAKFKNAKSVRAYLQKQTPYRNYTCKQLNELAVQLVLDIVPEQTKQRFQKHGKPFIFLEDEQKNSGFTWILSKLTLKETDEGLEVKSPTLWTDPDFKIKAFAGMQYCHLLSPARAAEWIYVDSLRQNYKPQ